MDFFHFLDLAITLIHNCTMSIKSIAIQALQWLLLFSNIKQKSEFNEEARVQ